MQRQTPEQWKDDLAFLPLFVEKIVKKCPHVEEQFSDSSPHLFWVGNATACLREHKIPPRYRKAYTHSFKKLTLIQSTYTPFLGRNSKAILCRQFQNKHKKSNEILYHLLFYSTTTKVSGRIFHLNTINKYYDTAYPNPTT